MRYSLGEIAAAIGADVVGDESLVITGLEEPARAGPSDLALASNPTYADSLGQGTASAALLWHGADWQAMGLAGAILPTRPRFAMSGLTQMMDPGHQFGTGIHPTAVIDPSATIGPGVTVGVNAVIGPEAKIGAGCTIGPQSFVGWRADIGPDAFLREQVSIGARVRIGARFIAQPGARIGGDGFSYVTPEKSSVEEVRETLGAQSSTEAQHWARIASLGAVVIGDDVEIGINSGVDSGTIRPTQIGNRTKIDSLCHVGHNVVIGEDNLICGQVGIAGSVVIGNFCVFAGQCGIADNITIADRVVLGAASKVMSSVREAKVMLGYPATEMKTHLSSYKNIRRLPRLFDDVSALKKSVFKSGGSD
ncbi:MAG: UDP-3-O-(3-hydroxymyristoyl)glucosamine N-acyltransferase [Pseudomonadota bacterium]